VEKSDLQITMKDNHNDTVNFNGRIKGNHQLKS